MGIDHALKMLLLWGDVRWPLIAKKMEVVQALLIQRWRRCIRYCAFSLYAHVYAKLPEAPETDVKNCVTSLVYAVELMHASDNLSYSKRVITCDRMLHSMNTGSFHAKGQK
eukprot:GDKI01012138.1.p1 GENE.GDKI01012138.1~~GDKI01012138.1.p1  ORF type:complete len:111 (+),score=2.36 GDKI01012138.1:2-334(+)